jgi:hypothetical protein
VFARQNLDPASLGGLIDLVGNIALGDAKARSADVLGHVFLKRLLRQYDCPPDMQLLATETVLKQAEIIANELACS